MFLAPSLTNASFPGTPPMKRGDLTSLERAHLKGHALQAGILDPRESQKRHGTEDTISGC